MLALQTCPNCNVKAVPTSDNLCPACRLSFEASADGKDDLALESTVFGTRRSWRLFLSIMLIGCLINTILLGVLPIFVPAAGIGPFLSVGIISLGVGGTIVCYRLLRLRLEIIPDGFIYRGLFRTSLVRYEQVSGYSAWSQKYSGSKSTSFVLLSHDRKILAWLSEDVLEQWSLVEAWVVANFGVVVH